MSTYTGVTNFQKTVRFFWPTLYLFVYSRPLLIALLHRDEADTLSDCRDYNFDMTLLADHLRRQIDLNKNAAYFNIDILKYQVNGPEDAYSTTHMNI